MAGATDPLLEPFKLKNLVLRNRIMSTAHACGLEEEGGMPAETYQRYHEEKARGGLALTMFGGSAFVAPDSTWAAGQLNVGSDRIIPYLQNFSQRVHAHGTALMMQITHLGRRGETNTQNWLPTVAPSVVREVGHRSIPREIDKTDIQRIVTAFGDAAHRCKVGGLDGIEVMTAGHLIGQFFSPVTNRRTDDFGGSLENRCRFGLMVFEEIRQRVGDDYIVGMRFLIDEAMRGGLGADDCIAIAQMFERSGTIDFFNANYGRLDTELTLVTDCMPGMASPIAPWLERVGKFKREVTLPVFHAARVTDLATARYAISEGLLDMVAMTRAHIADPQLVNKLSAGEEERVRPCVGTMHCMSEKRPTCVHNAATGRERFWPQVIKQSAGGFRRVVIVGGGPAGLEAARISAERGHDVVLFEAADALGGQLRLAAGASWRGDITGIVDWRIAELARLNVDVRLNHYASGSDVLAEKPAVIIIASGGVPHDGWMEGAEHMTSAWDILSGATPIAEDVMVYDGTGRHGALSAADRAIAAGASVNVALVDDRPAAELAYGERVIWKRTLAEAGIVPLLERRLTKVTRDGNQVVAHLVNELTGVPETVRAAQVITDLGTEPVTETYDELRAAAQNDGHTDVTALLAGEPQSPPVDEGYTLHRIGDAVSSRNLASAMFDALRLCSTL
jgi:2,4-dienoyl-CoA reductase-like NADH-dependent reductase (Old Yellow Enzyme family)